jgi:hypothetical protein
MMRTLQPSVKGVSHIVRICSMAESSTCVAKHFAGRLLTVKLNPVGQSMEIVVYLADAKGGVSRVLADASVALEETDTQSSFTARVYDLAESLLVDAVDAYCAER